VGKFGVDIQGNRWIPSLTKSG